MASTLISGLTNAGAYRHPVGEVEVIETHISWVLLAGGHAYKIKKPVVLPFADFGSLAARKHYCEEELRLNRRLAPHIYLAVVPITGSTDAPHMDGEGTAIEYAVKMLRFDRDALFDRLLTHAALQPVLIDRLAARIAAFHRNASVTMDEQFGTPARILQSALANFAEMAPFAGAERSSRLRELDVWTRKSFARLEPVFEARHRGGFVRECHGDLHLRNIALINGEPVPFDCIEFNAALRWLDVMDEAAFLTMDLMDRGYPALGFRFLDHYLADTGDYAGIAVLRFYLIYRAVVRAKVHDLRARQATGNPSDPPRLQAAADHYLALAHDLAKNAKPALILMHGFSGSGKSRVAAALAEAMGAIRIRSDVERKRLFKLAAHDHSGSATGAGIYRHEVGERTYARLGELAKPILGAGWPVILDAAFLSKWQREPMYAMARCLDVPIRIVACNAAVLELRRRVAARHVEGIDPSEATVEVLEQQISGAVPPDAAEREYIADCCMDGRETDAVRACVARVLASLPNRGSVGRLPDDSPPPARNR